MMRAAKGIVFMIAGLLLAGVFAPPACAALKAGSAKADTTPQWPVYLGGYYYINTRTDKVHDSLHARALALNDGSNTLIFITYDCVIMGGVFSNELKEMIKNKLGVPPENVTVSATHTHTGPEGYYEEFGKYPKEYDPKLKQFMHEKGLEAAAAAVKSMKPATAQVINLQLPEFMGNRHDPDGPEDPTSIFLLLRDEKGVPFAGFLNFPSHPTSAPAEELKISADWPGFFTGAMEKKLGPDATFLFLQGASGNISPRGGEGDTKWAEIEDYGNLLANAIWAKKDENAPGSADVKLGGALKRYNDVPVRKKKSATEFASRMNDRIKEIEASTTLPADVKKRRIGWLKERVGVENFMQPMIKSMKRTKDGKTETVVQALRIGDTAVVALPGEPIAEVSINLRKRFSGNLVVMGYTGDHLGYLTTNEVYEEGGYEAGMGLVYPQAVYKFMDDAETMAKELLAK